MKRSILAIITATLFLTGCYRDDLWDMHVDIKSLENETIASLSEQATNIQTSIKDLNELNTNIYEFIEVLESSSITIADKLSETQTALDNFKQTAESTIGGNAEAFQKRIDDLNTAVMTEVGTISALTESLNSDGDAVRKKANALGEYIKIFAKMEWADGTFATLSVQNSLISDLSVLKERINAIDQAAEDLDNKLTTTIKTAFDDFDTQFNDDLKTAISEVESAYTNAVAELSRSLKEANTAAIKKAVEDSEASVMSWINEELKDFYTVEQANAQYKVFDLILGVLPDGKASFQQELTDLYSAITDVRSAVTAAYEKAIADAVEKHEGAISAAIAAEIQKLRTERIKPLSDNLATAKTDIGLLKESVTALTGQITSAEEQRTKISNSLSVLTTLKKTLGEYVQSVKAELENSDKSNYDALQKLIDDLDALVSGTGDASLPTQIAALDSYIGTIPAGQTDIASWIETTLATINAQFNTIKLTSEVDGIFNAIKATLTTDDGRIKALEDGLDSLLVENETKIKGWITTKLQAYNTAADIEGFLNALEDEIKACFTEGDTAIQTRIDSLSNALTEKKRTLTSAYEKALSDAITTEKGKVDGRIISDFAAAEASAAVLKGKADSLGTVVSDLRKELTGYMTDVNNLEGRMTALETFLSAKKENGDDYGSLKAVVDDLLEKIGAADTTYANKAEFDKMNKYIKDTLSVAAGKVDSLVTNLSAVKSKLGSIDDFVGTFSASDSLHKQVTKIRASVDSLTNCVFDANDKNLFQAQIDSINVALYGKDGTADSPAAGSIVSSLKSLDAYFNAKHISSITYVPRYLDQTTEVYHKKQDVDSVYIDFQFIIRPAELASSITDYLSMKYKPIDGGASDLTEFPSCTFKVDGDVIKVSVSEKRNKILDNSGKPKVCAALFYNCTDTDGTVLSSFTSKFIFLSVNDDESTGNIPYEGDRVLHFPASGDMTYTVTIGADDMTVRNGEAYWLIRRISTDDYDGLINKGLIRAVNNFFNNNLSKPSWINVNPEFNYDYNSPYVLLYPFLDCYSGKVTITISVSPNTSAEPRSGVLTFRKVFSNIESFIDSATGGEDLIIYIEQDGKID